MTRQKKSVRSEKCLICIVRFVTDGCNPSFFLIEKTRFLIMLRRGKKAEHEPAKKRLLSLADGRQYGRKG
jgi:hypothetical protein